MSLLASEVRNTVEEIFPEYSHEAKLHLQQYLREILEGKDLGTFKGDVSVFKQRAIDTAAAMPASVVHRRGLERDALKTLDKEVSSLEKDMLHWVSRLKADGDRKISETRFRKEMKARLRIAYVNAYRLGTRASGLVRASDLTAHTSADEKRWIENVFSREQKYFNKFLDAVIKGESLSKTKVRVRNYANAIRSVFESSKVLQLPDQSLIHWVLQSSNPCSECRLLKRLSPFTAETLPTTPKAGSTRCLSNCWCRLRVVKAKPAEILSVSRKNKSAEYLLKKLRTSRKSK